jgi:hypothetical protein
MVSYIPADLLVSLSCTPCLTLSTSYILESYAMSRLYYPAINTKYFDALLLGLVLEGGVYPTIVHWENGVWYGLEKCGVCILGLGVWDM